MKSCTLTTIAAFVLFAILEAEGNPDGILGTWKKDYKESDLKLYGKIESKMSTKDCGAQVILKFPRDSLIQDYNVITRIEVVSHGKPSAMVSLTEGGVGGKHATLNITAHPGELLAVGVYVNGRK